MFTNNLLIIFPLPYYYEIYLLQVMVVLLPCNSLMLSKLKLSHKLLHCQNLILTKISMQTCKKNKNKTG